MFIFYAEFQRGTLSVGQNCSENLWRLRGTLERLTDKNEHKQRLKERNDGE